MKLKLAMEGPFSIYLPIVDAFKRNDAVTLSKIRRSATVDIYYVAESVCYIFISTPNPKGLKADREQTMSG